MASLPPDLPAEFAHNPFAAQYIRPGAIPFLFPAETSADLLVQKLAKQHWQGEICGPHGTGKSTLLHTLREHLLQAGRELVWFELKQGQHVLPAFDPIKSTAKKNWGPATLVIVDGAEQLSIWQRTRLRLRCRWHQTGLLWTTHRPLGLPTLWETQTSLSLAEAIVAQLMPAENGPVPSDWIASAFKSANANLREMLFQLFDRYQSLR